MITWFVRVLYHNRPRIHARTINTPNDGKYTYLSAAITRVKPIPPIVGKIATKKNNQPTKYARVHRQEMSNTVININDPMMPASTMGCLGENGFGSG